MDRRRGWLEHRDDSLSRPRASTGAWQTEDSSLKISITGSLKDASRVLVSTTSQTTASATTNLGNLGSTDILQEFTTGSNAAGYTVTSADIEFGDIGSGAGSQVPTVGIYTPGTNRLPAQLIGALAGPASLSGDSTASFTSGDGIRLDANTTYVLYVDSGESDSGARHVKLTASDDEDDASIEGWSAADIHNRLVSETNLQSQSNTVQFAINDYDVQ